MVIFTNSTAINIRHANSTEAMLPTTHFLLSRNSHLILWRFHTWISTSSVFTVFT